MIAGFLVGAPWRASADAVKTDAPPKVEESTPDTDKAAVHSAATDADKWAGTAKADKETPGHSDGENPPVAVSSNPAVSPSPVLPVTPVVPITPPAAAPPVAHRTDLNEMRGKLESKSDDPKTLRLIVEGGYNVGFTYNAKTTAYSASGTISVDDLSYGDELIVRYAGKELDAIEVERVSQAPRPQ